MPFRKGDPNVAQYGIKGFHSRVRNKWKRIGEARWASMTQEEKDYVNMKRDYANAVRKKQRERLNRKLEHTNFKVTQEHSDDEMDDIDNFFYGDVI